SGKTAYVTLPPPSLNGVPSAGSDTNPPPFASVAAAQGAQPSLLPADAGLPNTGASGPPATRGPAPRIANVAAPPHRACPMTAHGPGIALRCLYPGPAAPVFSDVAAI